MTEKNNLILNILCFLPKGREEGMELGYLRYTLPLEKARKKIAELLERVANGEIECFSVGPRGFDIPENEEEVETVGQL